MAHAGYNTQSAIIFVLLLPFLFSPSSLYIFLMEFHFLRVLKTCAKKRRCEKKLENTCLPYDKTTHPHTRRQYTERGERRVIHFFSLREEFRTKLFFLLLLRAWNVISEDGWWKFTRENPWKNLDDATEDSNSVPTRYESSSLSTPPSMLRDIFRFSPYIYIYIYIRPNNPKRIRTKTSE